MQVNTLNKNMDFNHWHVKKDLNLDEELLNFYLSVCNQDKTQAIGNMSNFLMIQGEVKSKIKAEDFQDLMGSSIGFGIWLEKNKKVITKQLKEKIEQKDRSYLG